MKMIQFAKTGGPEVMQLVDVELPPPLTGEVQMRHTAIGLNYIDTYYRSGLYPTAAMPSGLGNEAAGVVTALGAGVKGFRVGDRVAYGSGPLGSYAETRNFPANRLVKLPKSISDETAAGMMLKGMTVRYLLRATYKVKRGETILVHAAAGGVGLILSQWAKALGVKVIGTVGSDAKIEIAKAHGCAFVINHRNALALGDLAHPRRHILGAVVDDKSTAMRLGDFDFRIRANCANHLYTQRLGPL